MLSLGGFGGMVVDPETDSFRLLGKGYTTNGVSLTLSEPITSNLLAVLEYATGGALAAPDASAEALPEVAEALHEESAQEVTAELEGRVIRTGTKINAAYRWQPAQLVTPVAAYNASSDQPYLSFYVRQAVRWGDKLPPGLEATIDVTNLLAEGYRPFLSADGRTLYLAQAPRTVQAGLAFTF
jgi:hypothetical protein